jgi:hypothetical protein
LAEYGEENIRKSWSIATAELAKEAEIFKSQGSAIIPTIEFSGLEDVSKNQETLQNIRKRGIVVIRNVFPQEQALAWQSALDKYLTENKGKLAAWSQLSNSSVLISKKDIHQLLHGTFAAIILLSRMK